MEREMLIANLLLQMRDESVRGFKKGETMSTEPKWKSADFTVDELKLMWDAFAHSDHWPDGQPHIEDVHRMLNERGEGAYCAV